MTMHPTVGGSRLYQRGEDGYPIGADLLMRRTCGQIRPAEFFQRGYGAERPLCILGWTWSTTFNRWSAYVLWYDGTTTFTWPEGREPSLND